MKKNLGFTLVEVVMSIVIFGIAAYALITIFTIVAPKDINANTLTVGTHLMNSKMEETTLKSFNDVDSSAPSAFASPFNNYLSQIVVQYVTSDEPDVVSPAATDFKRIRVQVWGNNLQTIECVTIMSTYEM
jgi:prepilin-type N-terminal cleavage/methylation domain-containing protein